MSATLKAMSRALIGVEWPPQAATMLTLVHAPCLEQVVSADRSAYDQDGLKAEVNEGATFIPFHIHADDCILQMQTSCCVCHALCRSPVFLVNS